MSTATCSDLQDVTTTLRKADNSDPMSVQDLLLRAKKKTRQTTYRNRHIRNSTTASHTPGHHREQAEPRNDHEGLTSPVAPTSGHGCDDQHRHKLSSNPTVKEGESRQRSRSPRVIQTYSKKTNPHNRYWLHGESLQKLHQRKASQSSHKLRKRKVQQQLENNDDEFTFVEERIIRERRNPRRAHMEGFAIVKSIEEPRLSRSLSRVCLPLHMKYALQFLESANFVMFEATQI